MKDHHKYKLYSANDLYLLALSLTPSRKNKASCSVWKVLLEVGDQYK